MQMQVHQQVPPLRSWMTSKRTGNGSGRCKCSDGYGYGGCTALHCTAKAERQQVRERCERCGPVRNDPLRTDAEQGVGRERSDPVGGCRGMGLAG